MLIQVLIGEHDTSDSIVDRRDVIKITNHHKDLLLSMQFVGDSPARQVESVMPM